MIKFFEVDTKVFKTVPVSIEEIEVNKNTLYTFTKRENRRKDINAFYALNFMYLEGVIETLNQSVFERTCHSQ